MQGLNLLDYILDIDGRLIPKRVNPDRYKNAHADSFLTFLRDNRAVILNGRVTPQYNNYTFVSSRGSSVPDYIFCSLDNLPNCTSMKTLLISEIINDCGLVPPPSIPDHSLLSAKFTTSYFKKLKSRHQSDTFIDPPIKMIHTK